MKTNERTGQAGEAQGAPLFRAVPCLLNDGGQWWIEGPVGETVAKASSKAWADRIVAALEAALSRLSSATTTDAGAVESNDDELLPCPFCGHAGELAEVEPSGYVVQCTYGPCNASTNIRYSCGEDARPHVIEQWNRRAAPPSPPVAKPVAWWCEVSIPNGPRERQEFSTEQAAREYVERGRTDHGYAFKPEHAEVFPVYRTAPPRLQPEAAPDSATGASDVGGAMFNALGRACIKRILAAKHWCDTDGDVLLRLESIICRAEESTPPAESTEPGAKAQPCAYCGEYLATADIPCRKCGRFATAPADDARDAARYRFLRKFPRPQHRVGRLYVTLALSRHPPNEWCLDQVRDEELDAAIDAAMKADAQPEKKS